MMDGHPACPTGGIQHCVEQWPVGDRVGAVFHGFGFTVGRGDRAGIQMVAANHQGRVYLALVDQPVEFEPRFGALAILQPADSRGHALELYFVLGFVDPAVQRFLFRKQFKQGIVGSLDICRVATERRPTERSGAFTKQGADVCRHEPGVVKSLWHVPVISHLAAQVVAVIKAHGAFLLQVEDGLNMDDHGIEHLVVVFFWIGLAQFSGLLQGIAGGDVAKAQIVRGCLVGNHIRNDAAPFQFGQDVCNIAQQAD